MKSPFTFRPFALATTLLFGSFACASFSTCAPVQAQDEAKITLKVGDAAPPLAIATWWQDKKLEALQKNRVYLVDFWASWCQPCRESFPELAKFKKRYASEGLEVIAVSTDEDLDDAAQFLGEQGGKFDFFVGMDKREMSWKTWANAAGRTTIPTSFLVNAQGKIVWIGHPMEPELEPLLLKSLGEIPLDALPLTPKATA